MTMLKRSGRIAVFVVAAIGLGATLASAGGGWTVKPGGFITLKSGAGGIVDSRSSTKITCTSFSGKGTLKRGSGLMGAGIGTWSGFGSSGCYGLGPAASGIATFIPHFVANHLPWHVNTVSDTSGVIEGTLTGIRVTVSGACSSSVVLDGTGATADNGKVNFTYSDSTHKLKLLSTGANLHVYDVPSGCTFFHTGDAARFTTLIWTVNPSQTITGP